MKVVVNAGVQTDRDEVVAGASRVRAVFVSHSHFDHAFDAAYVTQSSGATLYGSRSTLNVARGGGVPAGQLREFGLGRPIRVGAFAVTVIRSRHSSHPLGGRDTPIAKPLTQPAGPRDYHEGGSYDFLVEHRGHAMLVKSSAGFRPGALDGVRAEVVFQGTATLGKRMPDTSGGSTNRRSPRCIRGWSSRRTGTTSSNR